MTTTGEETPSEKSFVQKHGRRTAGRALEVHSIVVYHLKGYSPLFQGGVVTRTVHVIHEI